MDTDPNNKIDCMKCIHFAVTWEPNSPKSCKLYGFKSARMPSLVVLQASGVPCMGFERKEVRK